jgi:hypothetical protein
MKFKLLLTGIISTFFVFGINSSLHGQNWSPMLHSINDNGINIVYADSIDNMLYMSGLIYSIDGNNYKGITRWNGSNWDSLGQGIDALYYPGLPWFNNLFEIIRYHNQIYVGGTFFSLGTVWSPKIGKWNGSAWDSLPVTSFSRHSGGTITALSVINDKLYVGGNFDSVANVPCNAFAIWNDTSWITIGMPAIYSDGITVSSICEYNGKVYFGGNFTANDSIPSDSFNAIISWDGSTWNSVGGGFHGAFDHVWDMIEYNGELYVSGFFSKNDGNVGNSIQKWNGIEWSEVGGGMENTFAQPVIYDLELYNNKLFAGGYFTSAGGIDASNIASWDGTVWCGLGNTFDNTVNSITFYKDTLIVGGGFWTIDGDSIQKIAKWTAGNYVDQCGNNVFINSFDNLFSFQIYPNPSTNFATILIPENFHNDNIPYSIYNSFGVKIKTGSLIGDANQVDLTELSSGVYFMEFDYNNYRKCKKFIKISE